MLGFRGRKQNEQCVDDFGPKQHRATETRWLQNLILSSRAIAQYYALHMRSMSGRSAPM